MKAHPAKQPPAATQKAPKPEFARWAKFNPACRLTAFNGDVALHDYMARRGVRLAGVDELEGEFEAGTPCSETHLVWVLFTGRVECDYVAEFRVMKSGCMAICPAKHPHRLRLASPKASGLWLHFAPGAKWSQFEAVEPGVYPGLAPAHLRGLVEAYLTNPAAQDAAAIGAKIHALELVLHSIEQALGQITGAKRHAFGLKIKTLQERIQRDLGADWTVAGLAKEMNMSPSYLHKATLRHLGLKPMAVVTRLRMDHAMSRLLQTGMTLADIAEEVGFASPFAFSAAFKREVGRSPSRFRATGYGSEV